MIFQLTKCEEDSVCYFHAVSVSGEGGDETMENIDEYVTITEMKDSHAMALAKQSTNQGRANV